jgi:MFS family permease
MKTLVLLSFGHLASHWYIGVFMLVLPLIKKDFMLSFTEVGFLMGNSTSGIIVDLIGKRHLILIASATGLGMCWLFVGFAHAYALLLVLFPLSNLFNNLWRIGHSWSGCKHRTVRVTRRCWIADNIPWMANCNKISHGPLCNGRINVDPRST